MSEGGHSDVHVRLLLQQLVKLTSYPTLKNGRKQSGIKQVVCLRTHVFDTHVYLCIDEIQQILLLTSCSSSLDSNILASSTVRTSTTAVIYILGPRDHTRVLNQHFSNGNDLMRQKRTSAIIDCIKAYYCIQDTTIQFASRSKQQQTPNTANCIHGSHDTLDSNHSFSH